MKSDDSGRLGAVLRQELGDPGIAEGLSEKIMASLPERPEPVVGFKVYAVLAAAAVAFMIATLYMNPHAEIFTDPSRLTASLVIANFGALLIAIGFLGWAADSPDIDHSSLALALQSLARHPVLRLAVKVAYMVTLFLAVIWVVRPARILAESASFRLHDMAGGLGVILLVGLIFAALGQFVRENGRELDRARIVRAVAVIVIVASCIVHYALVAL